MIGYTSKRIPIKKPIRLDGTLQTLECVGDDVGKGGLDGYHRHRATRCEEHTVTNHSLPALISDTSSLALPRSLSRCATNLSSCWPCIGHIRRP